MLVVINLFLAAIQPRSFFLPCAAIILGSGLAAFTGVVDGTLFSSLFTLTVLAQITFNLANDYQSAFVNQQSNNANPKQAKIKKQMLGLILACFLLLAIGLISLTHVSLPAGNLGYLLALTPLALLLMVIRLKTRYQAPAYTKVHQPSLIVQFLLVGFLPCLVSYYLHTSDVNYTIVLFAICSGLLATLAPLSTLLIKQFKAEQHNASGVLPSSCAATIKWQKVIAIISILATGFVVYGTGLPFFSYAFVFATPSLIATIATVEHIPDLDIAQGQATKVSIASFAYWVLLVVGLMF